MMPIFFYGGQISKALESPSLSTSQQVRGRERGLGRAWCTVRQAAEHAWPTLLPMICLAGWAVRPGSNCGSTIMRTVHRWRC